MLGREIQKCRKVSDMKKVFNIANVKELSSGD